jgi:protein SCO1
MSQNQLPRSLRVRLQLLAALGVAGFLVALVAATQLAGADPAFNGTTYPDAPEAPEFTLVDHSGREITLSAQRGTPVLLFFGFTRCPDVCPLTLRRVTRVLEEAQLEDRIRLFLITVDPEHDTPERLAEYVEGFGPAVTGLTGTRDVLEPLMASYGVYARDAEMHDGRATLAHSSFVFGIDRAGRLRVLLHADEPDDLTERDLRTLLRLR